MYVRLPIVRSGNQSTSPGWPMSSSSVSISATASRNKPRSWSAQRPYGSASCGGSATKRGSGRWSGGISKGGCSSLGRDDVERHAGAHLQTGELCEARDDIEVPAELARSARRGAHPHVQRGQPAEG